MNEDKERRAARRARDRQRLRGRREEEPRLHDDRVPVRDRKSWKQMLDHDPDADEEDDLTDDGDTTSAAGDAR